MILFPNAKINLGLHVLSKREDNFHNIETIMLPIGLCDILEFLPSGEEVTELKLSGIEITGEMKENLVYRAYARLAEDHHLPALKIHLHKLIPSGAGLGGGSSDAAFMLKGLNEYFHLNLSKQELLSNATELGSDCAFFIDNQSAIAYGRGEILEPVNNMNENLHLALFFPGFPVSTREAYEGVVPDASREKLFSIYNKEFSVWKEHLKNDFENTVFRKFPELENLKTELYRAGAVYVSMTGSGSAVYGLFGENYVIPSGLRKYLIFHAKLQ
ncbi:MAG: 4-(cytidine 5'-diphospho)-2-C-methyl-D-erythritol kinase [Bacteroidales bacterium]|nr:4-(cytidine 5'-diphospho)-2-C-methyl-D-erythritol kinase [Bacteroidales bacterium]